MAPITTYFVDNIGNPIVEHFWHEDDTCDRQRSYAGQEGKSLAIFVDFCVLYYDRRFFLLSDTGRSAYSNHIDND